MRALLVPVAAVALLLAACSSSTDVPAAEPEGTVLAENEYGTITLNETGPEGESTLTEAFTAAGIPEERHGFMEYWAGMACQMQDQMGAPDTEVVESMPADLAKSDIEITDAQAAELWPAIKATC